MVELTPAQYPLARALFRGLEQHLLVANLFEGQLTAQVLVDDPAAPRAGLIIYNSRMLLGGEPHNASFNAELRQFFANEIPQRKAQGSEACLVYYSPADWKDQADEIFSGCELIHAPRQYYSFHHPNPASETQLPEGFSLHLITPEFLASGLKGLEAVREEMCSERISVEDFLEKSFGLCPVYENEIAGWCMSEYNSGTRCEIGIATAEAHQRKGLATLTTLAFLAEAAKRGYTQIGWDCWTRNLASAATARKAGFTLAEEYTALVVVF